MANIKKTFTYNLPDDWTLQTSANNLTGTYEYDGPEFMYIFVNNETGIAQLSQSFIAAKTNDDADLKELADTRAGRDQTAVLLSPNTSVPDAIIASCLVNKDTDAASGYPQKEYKLDPSDANPYFTRPDPLPPVQAYNYHGFEYDLASKEWKQPFPWFVSDVTEESHKAARDSVLADHTAKLDAFRANLTPYLIAKAEAAITELTNMYTTYAGVIPEMIPFPLDPLINLIEEYDYNDDPDDLLEASGEPKDPEA